jgi:hypothetical protein
VGRAWSQGTRAASRVGVDYYRWSLQISGVGTLVVTAFFAVVIGFALIWHIWWLAVLGLLGVFATLLVFAFRDGEEIEISAEQIARFERHAQTEVA